MSIDAATIAALTTAQPRSSQPVQVTLIATPNNQIPTRIVGEVTATRPNGEAVIQTKSGEVTLKVEPPLQQGQRVDIKLPTQLPQLPRNTLPPLPLNASLTASSAKPALPLELPLAPPVVVELPTNNANPQSTVLPLYNAPKLGVTVQTIFQLVGLDLPASLQKTSIPTAPLQSANIASNTGQNPLTNAPIQSLQNVQVSFAGNQSSTQNFLQTQTVTLPNIATGQSAQGQSVTVPALANLIGFTPQKLPVFQIATLANLPKVPAEQVLLRQALSTLQTGDRVIIHQGVSSQNTTLGTGEKSLFTLNIKVPIGQNSQLQPSVQAILLETAPLLMQLIEEPESLIAPSLASAAGSLIPRVGTPQFAVALIMNLLGFSKGDPAPMLGKQMMEVLNDKQISTLRTEMLALTALPREGASPLAEGTRLQFPVEMNGQFFIWSIAYRSPYEDGRFDKDAYQKIEKPTRFILDFTMTRLGNFQVDGLSFYKSKRLDLIMRTDHALQPVVEQSFKSRAIDVFESAGMNGQIEFQTL